METIGECVGGCADGVQMDPPDPTEPDDWPDQLAIRCKDGGCSRYHLRSPWPVTVNGRRMFYFDVVVP